MPRSDDEILKLRETIFSLKVLPIDTNEGLQQHLNNAGFESGRVDGSVGPITTAAVRRFQQFCATHGTGSDASVIHAGPVDGLAGRKTRAALDHYYYYFLRQPVSDEELDAFAGRA